MQKITIKPVSEELIHKNGEDNVFCDVLSSTPMQEDEKHLGNLYVVGHVKSEGEDMGYMVNLISSLAKREYYSEHAKSLENPKSAFEHTLKKLNEVLEDFFKNKKFNLSIGLVAIAGESIYISRLGKFEVLLKRDGELIDILNNVDLFHKDHIQEKEFSNIISGKVRQSDTIFAYYPSKSFSAKKKQVRAIFAKADQEKFSQDIMSMGESLKNFLCCGVCMTIKQIKELPVTETMVMSPIQPIAASASISDAGKAEDGENGLETERKEQTPKQVQKPPQEQPPAKPALAPLVIRDMSLARRQNIAQKVFNQARKTQWLGSIQKRAKLSTMGIVVALVLAAAFGTKILLPGQSQETKAALQEAKSSVKMARNFVSQNDFGQARGLASAVLLSLSSVPESADIKDIKTTLSDILDQIDQVRPEEPQLLFDLSSNYDGEEKLINIAGNTGTVYGLTSKNNVFKLNKDGGTKEGAIKEASVQSMFAENGSAYIYNGSTKVVAVNGGKISENVLKNPVSGMFASLYQDNLYVLSADAITKYADATKGTSEGVSWLKDALPSQARFIAVDGKVYILSGDGIFTTYFKGTKEKEIKLPITPVNGTILTAKDSANLIYVNPDVKRIMVFSKSDGVLLGTYKASGLSDIKSWSLDSSNTLYLLSSDQKVWKLEIK